MKKKRDVRETPSVSTKGSGLVRKLLDSLGRKGSLPPPGQRSGSGSSSLAPYLEEVRGTRPGPLE
jgi:hypothetical protein